MNQLLRYTAPAVLLLPKLSLAALHPHPLRSRFHLFHTSTTPTKMNSQPTATETTTATATATTTAKAHQIIIDTDCGFDDLFALTLLLGSPTLSDRIKLITTVHGMTEPTLGARTVRRLLKKFNRADDIKVVAGADESGEGRCITDYEWGREYRASFSGAIEKLNLPEIDGDCENESGTLSTLAPKDAAAEALVSALSCMEPTTVLCLGPLTNLAAAVAKLTPNTTTSGESECDCHLVVMGGAVHCKGNMGPDERAELNFYCAASAARTVFHMGGIFRSMKMADLSTANDTHSAKVASFVSSHPSVGETPTAVGVLKSLVEDYPDSCTYDPIASSFLFDSGVLGTKKDWIVVDGVTGVTEGVEEGGSDGGVMVSLATDLDVDGYLGLIGGIMEGDEGEKEA